MTFLDFCAGIGGGRIGLENLGLSCLGFSEIDKDAEVTYRTYFGQDEKNFGDLMKINPKDLPDFDFMVGGFPCQTFSIIGSRCGLDDEKRGQIIYGLVNILKAKDVKYFILENVKGLVNHDKGNTFKEVLKLLDTAGYKVYHKVLNSLDFGVPQMRERIYLVGVKKELIHSAFNFEFPKRYEGVERTLSSCLIDKNSLTFNEKLTSYNTFLKYIDNKYNKGKYIVGKLLSREYQILDTRQSDLRIYNNKVPTLRRGRHGILYVKNGKFRKLSGYESMLLQGFPIDYANMVKDKIANGKLLQQTGNAMTTTVIEAITQNLLDAIGYTDVEKRRAS